MKRHENINSFDFWFFGALDNLHQLKWSEITIWIVYSSFWMGKVWL